MENNDLLLKGIKNRLNILNKQIILQKKDQHKVPIANILIQEAMNNEDLDFNDLIYSYNFIIKENVNIPMVLNIYQQNILNKDKLIQKDWYVFLKELKRIKT